MSAVKKQRPSEIRKAFVSPKPLTTMNAGWRLALTINKDIELNVSTYKKNIFHFLLLTSD